MIYFLRHGQTQANVDKICAGRTYPAPLTEKGREQAANVGEQMKNTHLQIDHIICSPMERTRDTAQIIAAAIGFNSADIKYDDRITEYDMGSLAGQSESSVRPQQYIVSGQTEDAHKFQSRVMSCLKDIEQLPGTTLIVSHDYVGRIIECTKQKMEPQEFYKVREYPNAQIVKLD